MGHATRVLCLVSALSMLVFGQARKPQSYIPKAGFVPDAATAVSIAEAVLIPVYGKDTVAEEKPFKAVLKGNIWVITGTVPCQDPPPGASCPGGAAEVRISKRSGAILFMTHYQ